MFRDKGSERKNKDDQKHLAKLWDKLKKKPHAENPFLAMFFPPCSITLFEPAGDYESEGEGVKVTSAMSVLDRDSDMRNMVENFRAKQKKRALDDEDGPNKKQRTAVTLYLKFPGSEAHTVVFLDDGTVEELMGVIDRYLPTPQKRTETSGNVDPTLSPAPAYYDPPTGILKEEHVDYSLSSNLGLAPPPPFTVDAPLSVPTPAPAEKPRRNNRKIKRATPNGYVEVTNDMIKTWENVRMEVEVEGEGVVLRF